jgi:hypothetical protein
LRKPIFFIFGKKREREMTPEARRNPEFEIFLRSM